MTIRFEPPLTVPKKMHASHEPYFAILRNYKDSRKKMVDFICGIGGYIDRRDRYAVEFDISAYCDLDRENLLHEYRAQFDDFGITGTPAELALEEQAFEKSMVEAVVERCGEGQCGQVRQQERLEDQGQPEANKNQADVFYRRVGKQTFHVRLHGRENNTEECGGQAKH